MPATTSPTLENLISLLAAYACVPPESIGMLDALTAIGIDSIDHIQLILDVEEAFAVEIPEDDANGIRSVAGLYDAILRAQGGGLD